MPANDFVCPNCGADVPTRAKACPGCGSDEKTGWSQNTIYDGTDIVDPDDDDFEYEDWKRREVEGKTPRHTKRRWLWWAVAFAALVAFVWLVMSGAL